MRNKKIQRCCNTALRTSSLLATLSLSSIVCLSVGSVACGQVALVGKVEIPGTSVDRSGLSGNLETNTPINAFGGLSAIDSRGAKNRYVVLSDRGAGDGAASFPCRYHDIELEVRPESGSIRFELLDSHLLSDLNGVQMTGSLEKLKNWTSPSRCPSYDPEGIRCLGSERVVISDEYGPNIDIFDRSGRMMKSVALPSRYALSERRSTPMTVGTFTNRGLEGIAVTPDQSRLVAAMQGPLVQDGRIENNKCLGLITRWFSYNLDNGESAEWVYPLDDESTGVSEVLAIDNQRYLVIERDSKFGLDAKIKKIFLADIADASDVSQVDSLKDGLGDAIRPIKKQLLIDLLNPEYGMSGEKAPEKPEGLAWGPTLPNGQRLLIVCFDNDFDPAHNTIFAAFAVSIPK
ncbi:MAG: esterase-like activity of phytase family protein [Pirellula sp.]|jgi:hypothetical protein